MQPEGTNRVFIVAAVAKTPVTLLISHSNPFCTTICIWMGMKVVLNLAVQTHTYPQSSHLGRNFSKLS